MSTPAFPEVLPEIQKWLAVNHEKIENFWIGADWRNWARYEIYSILDKAFGNEYLVTHDINLWESSDEVIDVLVEPRKGNAEPLAIRLRCEKVNENEGSFERFSKQYQEDWKMIQIKAKNVESDFDGSRILLLGLSAEEAGDEGFGSELKPEKFNSGNVNGWYVYQDSSSSS